jgi:hypothetical protein
MKRAVAFLAAFAAATAFAQHKAGDDHKPKYGGLVKEVKEIQYELVARPDAVTVYVEDHGKAVDMKGATGKVTFRNGAERSEATLAPAGGSRLEGKGAFRLAPGTVVILQVKQAGKAEESVRYTLK